jgi:hypothetical protein
MTQRAPSLRILLVSSIIFTRPILRRIYDATDRFEEIYGNLTLRFIVVPKNIKSGSHLKFSQSDANSKMTTTTTTLVHSGNKKQKVSPLKINYQ